MFRLFTCMCHRSPMRVYALFSSNIISSPIHSKMSRDSIARHATLKCYWYMWWFPLTNYCSNYDWLCKSLFFFKLMKSQGTTEHFPWNNIKVIPRKQKIPSGAENRSFCYGPYRHKWKSCSIDSRIEM